MHNVGIRAGDPPHEEFWIAQIAHSFENGHHVFTSKTKHISGLFIADVDAAKAFGQLVPAIQNLVQMNLQKKACVILPQSLDLFQKEKSTAPIEDTIAVIKMVA